jgi:hypothetical protein
MVCKTCGRYSHSEDANFCEYCGSPFKEHLTPAYNMNMPPRQMEGPMNGPVYKEQENNDKPVSFLNWLWTYGLLLIPYVGWLAFITLLFVWSFTKSTPVSKKNWARVNLIFTAVLIILIIVYIIIIVNSGMFQNILNGTFDYNSYYNDLFQGINQQ